MAQKLKAKIYKDDATENKPYVWFYVVDYAKANGERDTELDSYDYGSVESQEFAMQCVSDAFTEYSRTEVETMVWCPTCETYSRIVKSNSMVDYCENWHASNGYRVDPVTLEPFDEEE